ncbi:hypothetical protein FOMPIDRAFT_1052674 [Fomitopsis schrenkii]|uniref:Uncharacterized protein n=1 Tax=Fomitopsis schrenkii TaxID=2126942 RepID=S8F5Z9_FOMSC|nr:hypothetical protein FOMPIDRAFT_1052674 [Fomitopsis schrenkii]
MGGTGEDLVLNYSGSWVHHSVVWTTTCFIRDLVSTHHSSSQKPPLIKAIKLGQHLDALACCTGLSTVKLEVGLDEECSWQGLVTALYETLSHLSSPVIRTLQVVIEIQESSAWAQPESEFSVIDLQPMHDLSKLPLFDSLQRAGIDVWHREPRLTSDAVLTGDEMERRICLILKPWDRRGILKVERLRDELTYEQIKELELEPERTRAREARGLKELWSEASPEGTSRSSWDESEDSGDESGDSEDESGNSEDESENLGDETEDSGDKTEYSGEESEDSGEESEGPGDESGDSEGESEDSTGEGEDSGSEGEESGEGSEDSEDEIEDSGDGSEV